MAKAKAKAKAAKGPKKKASAKKAAPEAAPAAKKGSAAGGGGGGGGASQYEAGTTEYALSTAVRGTTHWFLNPEDEGDGESFDMEGEVQVRGRADFDGLNLTLTGFPTGMKQEPTVRDLVPEKETKSAVGGVRLEYVGVTLPLLLLLLLRPPLPPAPPTHALLASPGTRGRLTRTTSLMCRSATATFSRWTSRRWTGRRSRARSRASGASTTASATSRPVSRSPRRPPY